VKLAERIEIGPAYLRASLQPSTFDDQARTVEVVWSTGAEVSRYDWDRGRFIESLSLEPKHVRLDRLNAGASVLDNHSAWGGVRAILGVVERAWLVKGEGRATLRFSERADVQDIVRDVKAGIIRHISVGYRVLKFRDDTEKDANVKRYTAVDWEPFEVSLVTIPADAKAGVRSEAQRETWTCEVLHRDEPMTKPNFGAGLDEETRSTPPLSTPPGPPAAPTIDVAAIRREAEAQGAARALAQATEIRDHCRALELGDAVADRLIATGKPLGELTAEVRKAFVDARTANDPGEIRGRVEVGRDDLEKKRDAITSALFHRMVQTQEPPAELGELRGRSIIDQMRFLLAARSSHREAFGLHRDEVLRRSLHSTADFPELLQESGRRSLRESYAKQPTTYERFTRSGTLTDFKALKRIQTGDAPKMLEVPEGAEIKVGTMGTEAELVSLLTYGRAVGLTRQAIINDDLDSFSRLIAGQARTVAQLVERLAYTELTSGTVGGSSIYSTSSPNRKNVKSGGASALTADANGIKALAALAELIENQIGITSEDEEDFLGLQPKLLIVPTGLRVIAEQLTSAVSVTEQKNVNPYRGQLEVVASPRLNAAPTAWYLSVDPNQFDTIEVDWLDGNAGPQLSMKESFETRGVQFNCWAEVGAKTIDYAASRSRPASDTTARRRARQGRAARASRPCLTQNSVPSRARAHRSMKNGSGSGANLTLVAPSGGVESGKLYVLGGLAVVAVNSAAEGELFAGLTEGEFTFPKAAVALEQGGPAFYNTTTHVITDVSASGLFLIGSCTAAADSGAATGKVRLDGIRVAAV
jgi:predicted RecA/RadA family phage recombinase